MPPMAMRTWVSPDGDAHDVSDEHLYKFCRARGLHYENMLDHIETATSKQKNGGWRLIERLEVIDHVKRPRDHVPALGTLDRCSLPFTAAALVSRLLVPFLSPRTDCYLAGVQLAAHRAARVRAPGALSPHLTGEPLLRDGLRHPSLRVRSCCAAAARNSRRSRFGLGCSFVHT